MVNEYNVTVHIDGHYTIEDPKCPLYWRGSGCYDIDVPVWMDTVVGVWAVSEEQARELIDAYDDFDRGFNCDIKIDDVIIEKIELVGAVPDMEDDEVGVSEDYDIYWEQHTNEPPEREYGDF